MRFRDHKGGTTTTRTTPSAVIALNGRRLCGSVRRAPHDGRPAGLVRSTNQGPYRNVRAGDGAASYHNGYEPRPMKTTSGTIARRRTVSAEALGEQVVGKSTVARACQDTRDRYRAWCERDLPGTTSCTAVWT